MSNKKFQRKFLKPQTCTSLSNKKGEAMVAAIIIIIIVIVFIVGLVAVGGRECSRDSDCGEYSYCGADHGCHKFEIKETRVKEQVPTKPYWILGLLIVGGALAIKLTRKD